MHWLPPGRNTLWEVLLQLPCVKLGDVEHCGGEPERADTGILCHWWVDEWCNIFSAKCVDTMDPSLSNSTLMDPLNATDSSLCMHRLSLSLACLTSVRSDRVPSCSYWCQHCSLAPDAICLLHSVDSSVLSYTVRSPLSRSIAQNIKKL